MSNCKLTAEGKKYLEKGLPERRLIELLNKDISIKDIDMPDLGIALQWAKKKGLVEIRDNKLHRVKKIESWDEENALRAVSSSDDIDEKMLNILVQRRLVEIIRDDIATRAERLVGTDVRYLTEDLIKTGKWKDVNLSSYNVEVHGKKIYAGRNHPYLAFLDWVRYRLVGLGFEEMSGPLIETEFWNMDALYMSQYHAARDIHDVYFIKSPRYAKSLDKKLLNAVKHAHEKGIDSSRGWEYQYDLKRAHRLILRSHCTVLSAKTLASKPNIPGRYFSISRCFRYDKIDSSHLPDFFQVEGIVLDKGLNLGHLIGILKSFAREFAGTEKIKIKPGYFPFTEPSMELHAKHPELGWIELGGAGIFRPEMSVTLGINVPVIAWGLGVDRIGMLNMGISDIRELFTHDLNNLRSAKVSY